MTAELVREMNSQEVDRQTKRSVGGNLSPVVTIAHRNDSAAQVPAAREIRLPADTCRYCGIEAIEGEDICAACCDYYDLTNVGDEPLEG